MNEFEMLDDKLTMTIDDANMLRESQPRQIMAIQYNNIGYILDSSHTPLYHTISLGDTSSVKTRNYFHWFEH